MELKAGTTLRDGTYRIERTLGQGGFGITYLASMKTEVEGKLGKMTTTVRVAVKEFFMKSACSRNDSGTISTVQSNNENGQVDQYKRKFKKEADNIAKLSHTNIARVFDVFEENNTVYYVMEYLGNGSLKDRLKSELNGRLSEEEATRYINQIAAALKYMHSERHMCHYDLKPANIMLNDENVAKLIDFGLSKNYDQAGNQTSSTPIGISKGYAPLEQYQQSLHEFSPVSDIYSLGATLFTLVTGAVPPEASVVNEDGLGEKPDYLSQHIWDVIEKAMQPKRRQRPQNIDEFVGYLNGTLELNKAADIDISGPVSDPISNPVRGGDETIIDSKPNGSFGFANVQQHAQSGSNGFTPPQLKPAKKNTWLIPVVVVVFALIAAGLVFAFRGGSDKGGQNTEVDSNTQTPIYGQGNNVVFMYSGEMTNGVPNGKGKAVYTDSDKDTYTGNFQNGLRVDANATLTFKNGDRYEGSFVNDQFGEGTYYMKSDGSYFKGKFSNFAPYNGAWYDKSGGLIVKVINGKEQ
ncbi:MAG: protein kinase [Prevotella sp.]|nr:protein kinase [Prevotella sp.]